MKGSLTMGQKTRNTNYDHLERILNEADIKERQSNGVWTVVEAHPEGHWVVSKESFDRLVASTDAIEKYLRS